ncbi:MAG: lipoate--protein ligase family protein [Burkholderiaceae bacterium]|nr:lipoate--protein ligase family protein [Burkholderiaceae bacterium]
MAIPSEPPRLALLIHRSAGAQPLAIEQNLLDSAALGEPVACVWEPGPSLVVPSTYQRYERFPMLCERFEQSGWPVSVRRSGGGLVPQDRGVVNISLAWRTEADMATGMTQVYEALCGLLQDAVEPFDIDLNPQAVHGSFCDGRFNLAMNGRKVAGTAQYWQRLSKTEHVVLAHACLMVCADLQLLTQCANEFEGQLGSDKTYDQDVIANLLGDAPTAFTTTSVLLSLRDTVRERAVLC